MKNTEDIISISISIYIEKEYSKGETPVEQVVESGTAGIKKKK